MIRFLLAVAVGLSLGCLVESASAGCRRPLARAKQVAKKVVGKILHPCQKQ